MEMLFKNFKKKMLCKCEASSYYYCAQPQLIIFRADTTYSLNRLYDYSADAKLNI